MTQEVQGKGRPKGRNLCEAGHGFSGHVRMSSGTTSREDSALTQLGQRMKQLAKLGETYSQGSTS